MTIAEQLEAKGEARGEAKGEAKGLIKSLLLIFRARDLHVPDDVRTRVLLCSDIEQLDQWVLRAATVSSPEDIFED